MNMEINQKTFLKPIELFQQSLLVKICAPMVRYSKLPFRSLVRLYDCDLAFTPMIISNSFVASLRARNSEFTTNCNDRPLIVQFAAKDSTELANAAEIIYPFADGVDLNCGCPQRWAMCEGYGAHLLKKPECVREMVRETRNRIPDSEFSMSIKIRILNDIQKTVELCRQAEHAGVSWITVHARTPTQRNEPITISAVQAVVDSLNIPVILNGDVKSLEDANNMQTMTGVKGVMAARGILENPAMYAGYEHTPIECVREWIRIALSLGTQFGFFHHHLMFMLEHVLPKSEKKIFNTLTSTAAVLEYLNAYV